LSATGGIDDLGPINRRPGALRCGEHVEVMSTAEITILRRTQGLAASPPVRYTLKVQGRQ
jgi:hypothetical protein